MSVEITLTWAELLTAANIGCMRITQRMKKGHKSLDILDTDDGGKDYGWSGAIEGAAGEMAVAKHLGLFWSGAVGDLEADDVAGYQVKTNMSRKHDDLIIQKRNRIDRIYIGVLSFIAPHPGTAKFIITGWIDGVDGKKEGYWREGRKGMPAFFVPRSILHDINTLPVIGDMTA